MDSKSQLSITPSNKIADSDSDDDEGFNGLEEGLPGLPIDIAKTVQTVVAEIATTVVAETVKQVVKDIHVKERFPQPSKRLQRIAQPNMTSYISLYNNHRNVLKPAKIREIEEKMADIRKYSKVIADDLKVLIVDKINGIDQKQAQKLQMKIMESLETTVAVEKSDQFPRFLETSYDHKCIKIVCADEFTVKWLKDMIAKLPPSRTGAKLEVTTMSFYLNPSTKPKKPYKLKPKVGRVKFFIPTKKKVDFEEVIKRIEVCNQPIQTDSWKKLKEETTGKGIWYYVSMSKQSLDEIRNKNFSLFYLLGTIKIIPLNEDEEIVVTANDANAAPSPSTHSTEKKKGPITNQQGKQTPSQILKTTPSQITQPVPKNASEISPSTHSTKKQKIMNDASIKLHALSALGATTPSPNPKNLVLSEASKQTPLPVPK